MADQLSCNRQRWNVLGRSFIPVGKRELPRRRATVQLQLEMLEDRTMPSILLPLENHTGLDPAQYSAYVLGFSTISATAPVAKFLDSSLQFSNITAATGTIPSYEIRPGDTITIDETQDLIGARLYFFIAPPGQASNIGLGFTGTGAAVSQPINPPNSNFSFPSVFGISEITNKVGYGFVADVQTVDGFSFPMTLTLNGGQQVGQPLTPPGQDAIVNRQDIFPAYQSFMTNLGSAGDEYKKFVFPGSIAGQPGGILNPTLFLAQTIIGGADNGDFVNLNSPLNTIWDADLNSLFAGHLSIQGVAAGSIAAAVYNTTVTMAAYPTSGFTTPLPVLQFSSGLNTFNVFNPVGLTVTTDAMGDPIEGDLSADGSTLTLTNPPPVGELLANMYVLGTGVPAGATIGSITPGGVITLAGTAAVGPITGGQYVFSKLPPITSSTPFASPGLMVFGNSGVFADNTVQVTNADEQVVLGNLESQIAAALNRGVALLGITAGTSGETTTAWSNQNSWYPSGATRNLFSQFMHTGLVNGTPIFLRPPTPLADAQGTLMGSAYGFGFDENPPSTTSASEVPSKFDPVPPGTTTVTITLGQWFRSIFIFPSGSSSSSNANTILGNDGFALTNNEINQLLANLDVGSSITNTTLRENQTFTVISFPSNSLFLGKDPGLGGDQNSGTDGVGVISGVVFEDLNNTGILDSGNPGEEGAVLLLEMEQGGVFVTVGMTTSGKGGDFSFTGLSAGTYRVRLAGAGKAGKNLNIRNTGSNRAKLGRPAAPGKSGAIDTPPLPPLERRAHDADIVSAFLEADRKSSTQDEGLLLDAIFQGWSRESSGYWSENIMQEVSENAYSDLAW